MSDKCPQCGAALQSEMQCLERFERCLTKDYEQPATFGAVHHLIVICYMLQHNAYSRQGWLEAREMLAQFNRQDIPPEALRKRNFRRFDSRHRQWKLVQGPKIPQVEAIVWTRTILNVRLDTAEAYCSDAKRWATSVLEDTEPLLRRLERNA